MCKEIRPRQFPVTRLSGYKIAAPMSQFGHESHMGAGRRTFTYGGLVLDVEVACRRQKVHVLDVYTFTSPVPREHSVFVVASSTLLVSTPPKHAHWTLVLRSNGTISVLAASSLWKGKPWARGWAIAASLVFFVMYFH